MTTGIVVLWSTLAAAEAAGVVWGAVAEALPEAMRQAIALYHREDDRRLRLLTRLLLADALRQAGGSAPTLADIRIDPFGRPYLPGGYDLSLSHTGGLAVVAVATGARLGIDAEAVRTIDPAVFDLALSRDEGETLRLNGASDHAFLALWTAKEAAIKADGRGLSLDLRQVVPTPQQTVMVEGHPYHLHRLALPPAWIGTLAHDAPRTTPIRCDAYSFGS